MAAEAESSEEARRPAADWSSVIDRSVHFVVTARFHDALVEAQARLRSGAARWHSFDEVFG